MEPGFPHRGAWFTPGLFHVVSRFPHSGAWVPPPWTPGLPPVCSTLSLGPPPWSSGPPPWSPVHPHGAQLTPGLFHVQSEGSHQLLPEGRGGSTLCCRRASLAGLSYVMTLPQGLSPAPSGTPPSCRPPWAPQGQRNGLKRVHRSGVALGYEAEAGGSRLEIWGG